MIKEATHGRPRLDGLDSQAGSAAQSRKTSRRPHHYIDDRLCRCFALNTDPGGQFRSVCNPGETPSVGWPGMRSPLTELIVKSSVTDVRVGIFVITMGWRRRWGVVAGSSRWGASS